MLSDKFDYVVIDGEAGIEQINRRVMEKVTHLLLVTDASKKGCQVVQTIKKVADELVMYDRIGVIANRIPDMEVAKLMDIGGLELLSVIQSDSKLAQADVLGENVFNLPDDAIIVEGTEAGGHIGELTTMALVPQVVEAVKVPVIAAGGIASGKQVLAAYALGASGVQVGTCLLASEECPIHENYKQAIISAKDTSTTVTGRIAGTPVRIIKNKMAKEYIKREKEGADMMELEKYTLGSLKRAVLEGDVETGSLMAGQVAGMVNEIKPVAAIIEELFDECKQEFEKLESEF